MNIEHELKTLENALIFLKRTNLNGEEVIAFNEVMTYIIARQQGLAIEKAAGDTPPIKE
jgi:hypothetical protein